MNRGLEGSSTSNNVHLPSDAGAALLLQAVLPFHLLALLDCFTVLWFRNLLTAQTDLMCNCQSPESSANSVPRPPPDPRAWLCRSMTAITDVARCHGICLAAAVPGGSSERAPVIGPSIWAHSMLHATGAHASMTTCSWTKAIIYLHMHACTCACTYIYVNSWLGSFDFNACVHLYIDVSSHCMHTYGECLLEQSLNNFHDALACQLWALLLALSTLPSDRHQASVCCHC